MPHHPPGEITPRRDSLVPSQSRAASAALVYLGFAYGKYMGCAADVFHQLERDEIRFEHILS